MDQTAEDRSTGLVDWDLAGPGRPVEDLAYTAWHFVPLHGELMGDGSTGPAETERPRRLRVCATPTASTLRHG